MSYKSARMRRLNAAHMGEGGIKPVMLRLYDGGMTYDDLAAHFELPVYVVGYYMRQFLAQREEQENTHASPIAAA